MSAAGGEEAGHPGGGFELLWRVAGLMVRLFRYRDYRYAYYREFASFEIVTFVSSSIKLHPANARVLKVTLDYKIRDPPSADYIGLLLYFTMLTAGIAPAAIAADDKTAPPAQSQREAVMLRPAPRLMDLQVALTKLPSNALALALFEHTMAAINRAVRAGTIPSAYQGEGNRIRMALQMIGEDLFYTTREPVNPRLPLGILVDCVEGQVTVVAQYKNSQVNTNVQGEVLVKYGNRRVRTVADLHACTASGAKLPKCRFLLQFAKRTTTFHLRFKCPDGSSLADFGLPWVRERRKYWKAMLKIFLAANANNDRSTGAMASTTRVLAMHNVNGNSDGNCSRNNGDVTKSVAESAENSMGSAHARLKKPVVDVNYNAGRVDVAGGVNRGIHIHDNSFNISSASSSSRLRLPEDNNEPGQESPAADSEDIFEIFRNYCTPIP